MSQQLVSLSSICPSWTRNVTPATVEKLKRGIEIERARFQGRPFVVAVRQSELDYDGLSETVELVDGFTTEAAAIACARQCAEVAQQTSLKEPPSYSGSRWHMVGGPQIAQFDTQSEPHPVCLMFRESFRLATGSGYNERYCTAIVLYVKSAEIIGPELFATLDCEWELTRYLTELGKKDASNGPSDHRAGT